MQFHKILFPLLMGSYIGLADYHISQQLSYSLLFVRLKDKISKKGDRDYLVKNIVYQLPREIPIPETPFLTR